MASRLLCLIPLLLLSPPSAATPPSTTHRWLHQALESEVAEKPAERWDWNLIASVTFPLARYQRRHPDPGDAMLLERTARRIDDAPTDGLSCGELTDRYLTGRFLEQAGIGLKHQPDRQRLAACLADAPPFDRANTLLLACRYGAPVETDFVQRAAAELAAGQDRDGGFSDRGRSGYYLTTHAMLALHECGGHQRAVTRAAEKLTRHLEPFLRRGFLDGLAESLIFLRWVGQPAAEEARYRREIERWIGDGGGLCFTARPGCRPHWHATALLLELLDS